MNLLPLPFVMLYVYDISFLFRILVLPTEASKQGSYFNSLPVMKLMKQNVIVMPVKIC